MANIPVLTVYDDNGNEIPIPAIRGEKGDSYVLTAADKQEIASIVKGQLNKETWTFTLEDGTTVTKAVYVG